MALLLGLSTSAASPAERPVPWVGVLGPRVTVEALRDRGVPAEAASLAALPLAEAGAGSRPRLLLAQAGAVSSPTGVSSLEAFLRSGGKLLLFGWGPYVGPERRASAPLYTLEPLLGVRVAAYSPKGSRWVQLRDPGIGTEGGWSTVLDLGDGPSSVLEARPGAEEWVRWVSAGHALRGGTRSAAVVTLGGATTVGRDLLARSELSAAGLDLLLRLIRRVEPAAAPQPEAGFAPPEPGPESAVALPEVQGLWLAGPDAAPLSALRSTIPNTVVVPLTDAAGCLNPRLWEDSASRGRLLSAAESIRRGRTLWVEVPVLRGGRGETQGQWLRAHPDWGLPGPPRFDASLPGFRRALLERVTQALELLKPDGVLFSEWWNAGQERDCEPLLDRLAAAARAASPHALVFAAPSTPKSDPQTWALVGLASDASLPSATVSVVPLTEALDLESVALGDTVRPTSATVQGPQPVGSASPRRSAAARPPAVLGTLLRLPSDGEMAATAVGYPGLARAVAAFFGGGAGQPQKEPLDAAGLYLASLARQAPRLRRPASDALAALGQFRLSPRDAGLASELKRATAALSSSAKDLPSAAAQDLAMARFWVALAMEGR